LDYTGAIIENEEVFNERPYVGRFFTEAEDLHRADVAIIGYDLGKTFFPRRRPDRQDDFRRGISLSRDWRI